MLEELSNMATEQKTAKELSSLLGEAVEVHTGEAMAQDDAGGGGAKGDKRRSCNTAVLPL